MIDIDCKEASRLYSESMHHPLPLLKFIALKLHLMICDLCRKYVRQLKFLRRSTRLLLSAEAENGADHSRFKLSDKAKRRLKLRLRQAANARA
jgi:hypothetical protein